MTRRQSFFGQLVIAADIVVLTGAYLAAYHVRSRLWRMGYPVLPFGGGVLRTSGWILSILLPAWLFGLRYFNLYNPRTFKSISGALVACSKAQVIATILMLNAVFILRGFAGVSRPLLALIVVFSFIGLMFEKVVIVLLMKHQWRLRRPGAASRVLIVGSRSDAERYLELVREHPEWNLEIVGIVSTSAGESQGKGISSGDLYPTTER
jgi:FlaA1/EpsC-like NDP-sugar epimerase